MFADFFLSVQKDISSVVSLHKNLHLPTKVKLINNKCSLIRESKAKNFFLLQGKIRQNVSLRKHSTFPESLLSCIATLHPLHFFQQTNLFKKNCEFSIYAIFLLMSQPSLHLEKPFWNSNQFH